MTYEDWMIAITHPYLTTKKTSGRSPPSRALEYLWPCVGPVHADSTASHRMESSTIADPLLCAASHVTRI